MRSHELVIGRSFAVVFDHEEEFFPALAGFCDKEGIRKGYIPFFVTCFSSVKVVGTCERIQEPGASLWSHVYLANVEAPGAGTVAFDPERNEDAEREEVDPHIHASVKVKERSAVAHTSHLLEAHVQFLTEMVFVEVLTPTMTRRRDSELYDVPLLGFSAHRR